MQMARAGKDSAAPPLLSVFILSCAALAYEVLLIRLFSVIHWHHFAFMVISIALLGYGISGSLITVFRRWLLDHYAAVFITNIVLFGFSSIGCFIIVQQLPFNTLEILWDHSQWQRLLLSYLLLTLPFFFVANAIALTMIRFHHYIPQIYGYDLIGAGIGAILIMVLLQNFTADTVLRLLAISGLSAGLFALANLQHRQKRLTAGILLLCGLAIISLPHKWLDLRLSEYKGLAQTLLIKDAALIWSHSSPVSQIDVVKSPLVPFRHAPGLSLQSPLGPPEQLAVFSDGDEMTAIDHVVGRESLEYHDYMSSALPYHVKPSAQRALILGSASGAGILQAHFHQIPGIDAVEPDHQLSQLISEVFADYIGWSELQHKVSIHTISARGFAAAENDYDLVIIGPAGGSAGGSAGVHALSTSYDYTVEALQSYLDLLGSDGLLSITLWTSTPARGNLKLFNTAVTAMRASGIDHPENNIAWIRSWNTATLLLKNSALTDTELDRVRAFSRSRNFDLAWLAGITADEVNRYHRLQEPVYYLAARAFLSDTGERFTQEYKYDIQASTDNIPYFNNYFRWSSLNEFMAMPGKMGISLTGVGYPTLLVTLAQAAVASIVLILLPLLFVKTGVTHVDTSDDTSLDTNVDTSSHKTGREDVERINHSGRHRNIVIYYLAIGLAFLFIELAFIQKFTLILSQPLYAVAVTLCAFLIFSGLGSLYVQRCLKNGSENSASTLLKNAVMIIGLTTVLYIFVLPQISAMIMAMTELARILTAIILAAPLAFAMGMPFPLGLASLQRVSPHLIPWAWGINGCASVLSAILAVLLAIEIGFNGVMLCAVALYFIAWLNHRSIDAADRH